MFVLYVCQGTIPSTIGSLTALTDLELHVNSLSGMLCDLEIRGYHVSPSYRIHSEYFGQLDWTYYVILDPKQTYRS